MTHGLRTLALAVLAAALAACASQTTLSDVWVADGLAPGAYRKVLVIAIGPDQDRRMAFEDAMSRRIPGSAPSHSLMSLGELADRAKVKAKLEEKGFDGVLVVRLLGVDVDQSTMPGHATMLSPNAGLYGYWDPAHAAFERDYQVTARSVSLEVMFFDVASAERKFRAESQSYNPADQSKLADGLFDALRAELKKRGVL